jgi:hypothetical protein
VKRSVISFEEQSSFLKPEMQSFALLECGHRVKIDTPRFGKDGIVTGRPGELDCPECEAGDGEAT